MSQLTPDAYIQSLVSRDNLVAGAGIVKEMYGTLELYLVLIALSSGVSMTCSASASYLRSITGYSLGKLMRGLRRLEQDHMIRIIHKPSKASHIVIVTDR